MAGTTTLRFITFLALILSPALGLGLLTGCGNNAPTIADVGIGVGTPSANGVPRPPSTRHDIVTTVGTVDEIDYASMLLRVGHSWFWADAETEFDIPACEPDCTFGDVQLGDPLKVKHDRDIDGCGYYAREIEVEQEDGELEEPEADEVETEGEIQAVDGDRLMVSETWFWTDTATELEIDGCADESLRIGDRVKIEHSTIMSDGLGFYAFKIEIKRECDDD